MLRTYDSGWSDENPKFFLGLEVEKTAAHNEPTLFCRGDVSLDEIIEQLDEPNRHITHVYLNHNHTELFDAHNKIDFLLDDGFYVTWEVSLTFFNEYSRFPVHDRFITLVTIPVRGAERNNAYLKVDDVGFDVTNSGVWTFNVRDLRGFKTEWFEYKDDKIV